MEKAADYKHIFGDPVKAGFPEISEKAVKDFPYFTAARLALLRATSPEDNQYNTRLSIAGIHFNNSYYLNYILKYQREPHDKKYETSFVLPDEDGEDETALFSGVIETGTFEAPASENVPAVVSQPENHLEEVTDKKPQPSSLRSDEPPLFEPLYTTDYFASQGIKLSEEIKADDKLGKQLRSFTDWLKTMKKVHEQRLPPGNEQMDVSVVNMAEKSNKEDEVITESMAEAYNIQGKTGKAIEIYEKLSLLNPSKSAYFAAKIEFLKDR